VTVAAIYARLSQNREGESTGTDRQQRDCRAYAERKGYEVAEVYEDDDRSAYSSRGRPAFDRLMSDLDRFDVVVFWKTDRLIRRFVDWADVLRAASEASTALECVVEPLDTSTPMGQAIAGMFAGTAEQESANIGLRVKREQEERAENGLPHGGRRPFGYARDGLSVRDDEAERIREAAGRVIAGDSLAAIVRDWNEQDVGTSSGAPWSSSSLRTLLRGPRIAGLRQHNGEIIGDAAWPAIIDPATRERLVGLLGGRSRTTRKGREPKYLLSGLATCAYCGSPLYVHVRRSGRRRYVCLKQSNGTGCAKVSMNLDDLDRLIRSVVIEALSGDDLADALADHDDEDASEVAQDLVAARTLRGELAERLGRGEIDRDEWMLARAPLQERIDTAEHALERNGRRDLGDLLDPGDDLAARWDAETTSTRWRRDVVQAVLASVVVHGAGGCSKPCDWCDDEPGRVELVWRA
jgi:site-specific DNA recombinase